MRNLSLRLKLILSGLIPWLCMVAVLALSLVADFRDLQTSDSSGFNFLLWKTLGSLVFSVGLLAFIIIITKSVALSLRALAQPFVLESKSILDTAQAVIASGTELSSASIQQASSLQQIVSSADEINAMVSKNAESAKKSAEVSEKSASAAVKGKETVVRMLGSIDEISQSSNQVMQQMQDSNRKIAEIVKVIKDIGKKTEVINDIVFQTKLLSFNASVEAARAGEHGRGFSVVAEEVGNLASMSGAAAGEISSMLTESISKVELIMKETTARVEELMSVATSKVDQGKTTAQECSISLEEIVENISVVNNLVKEISEASNEQALGVKEITSAMGQLEQVTQQNSSRIQSSIAHSKVLESGSSTLQNLAAQFSKIISPQFTKHPADTIERPVLKVVPKSAPRPPVVEARGRTKRMVKGQKSSFSQGSSQVTKQAVGDTPHRADPRFEEI